MQVSATTADGQDEQINYNNGEMQTNQYCT